MKKYLKKICAFSLVASMMLSSALNVSASTYKDTTTGANTATTVIGTSTVNLPIYKVALPTALVFGLDPYELKGTGQVTSGDFAIVNRSNVPVKVTVASTLTPATGTTMIKAADIATISNTVGVLTKQAYFTIVTATAIDSTSEVDATKNNVKGTYDLEKAGTIIDFVSNKSTMIYALAPAAYNDTAFSAMAANDKGVATFKFQGKLNPYADWKAADLKISTIYTISGLLPDDYTALGYVTDAHTLVDPSYVAPVEP
jgi:hypothetical protein